LVGSNTITCGLEVNYHRFPHLLLLHLSGGDGGVPMGRRRREEEEEEEEE